MDGDTQVTGGGSPRASRAARDLVPVTAAAGAAALFVTIVVGGTTSELHTASLAERTPSVVDPSTAPAADRARDVTVRVTPRPPRSAATLDSPALPADAGTLFDLAPVPAAPARTLSVASAPTGLTRLSFPFTPSTSTALPAGSGGPVTATLPDELASPAGEAGTPAVTEPSLAPRRAPSKAGKVKTTETDTRSTFSTTTATTVSLQWSSVDGASTDDGGDGDGKRKAKGRPEDPPPDHSQADEHSKADRF